ncbi:hypothetical protein GCM10010309_67630 [Streptomyces violaceochromogenes]|nr:hypothetical protein GCM10010309_67630 [Streptomyces violaceochromogenes]
MRSHSQRQASGSGATDASHSTAVFAPVIGKTPFSLANLTDARGVREGITREKGVSPGHYAGSGTPLE